MLTQKEWLIARLVTAGLTNAQIGKAIGVTRDTTKNYVVRIYDKTGMGNRVELAMWYLKHREESW